MCGRFKNATYTPDLIYRRRPRRSSDALFDAIFKISTDDRSEVTPDICQCYVFRLETATKC